MNGRKGWNPDGRLRTQPPSERKFREQYPTGRAQQEMTCRKCGDRIRAGAWTGKVELESQRVRVDACYACYKQFEAIRLRRKPQRGPDRRVRVTYSDPDPGAAVRAAEAIASEGGVTRHMEQRHTVEVSEGGFDWSLDVTQGQGGHLYFSIAGADPTTGEPILTLEAQGTAEATAFLPPVLFRGFQDAIDLRCRSTRSARDEERRRQFPRAGDKWLPEDDDRLLRMFRAGTITSTWPELQRTAKAVWMRLQHLGVVQEDDSMPDAMTTAAP